jgi:uncharacterized protein (TIGR03086 family)
MALETTYRRSVEFWKDAVQNAAGDWSAPTPCTEWNVRALVNHVVGEDRWTKPLVDGKTIAEVGNAFDGDLLGEDPKSSAQAAADEALAAVVERLPAGGKVHLSYGEEDIGEYISQLAADHLIHGWDLAAATGQTRDLDPELVADVPGSATARTATALPVRSRHGLNPPRPGTTLKPICSSRSDATRSGLLTRHRR